MEFKIRDYKKGDFQYIIKLWEKTGLGSEKRGDNEEIIFNSIKMGGKLLVLEINNVIEGTSWMTFDGRRIHLHHIAVSENYRNNGFGKFLTQKSIEFAKGMNCQIKLEVHKSNYKAIDIYKKAGFKYLGDYDIYIIRSF